MFTDIEDSTVLSQQAGDLKWTQIVEDHFTILNQAIKRRRRVA